MRFRLLAALLAAWPVACQAQADDAPEQSWAIHGQSTFVLQANPAFHSPYEGPNSLNSHSEARETFDLTGYVGVRPWGGAEIWVDPEIDQGFGLSNTLGVAGFPSGEAYKVGKSSPYAKLPRWFLRQTIDLGGDREKVDADLNQLRGSRTANRLVLTVGKFSVVDVFDTNGQAHDPRTDFLNWAVVDAGTFDYAANAWGSPTARRPSSTGTAGPFARARSTCPTSRIAPSSTGALGSTSWMEKSRSAIRSPAIRAVSS